MRNLKRALSLTLASVMLLGMMVVGSSAAAGYSDVDAEDNVEAIEVLQAVEVMVGDDRGFGPDRPVTRNEMAVVMGKLLNLDYNYYVSTCPFTDVADWAKGWVGACAANGIVSGRGNGIYDGESTVTAVEAASMMMRALGYFRYQNDYADGFMVSTVRQGTKIGIFDNVGTDATTPMTRNQVAQMALNALQTGMVEPDGNTINLTTPDGSVFTGKVNYVFVTSAKPFASAISPIQATAVGSQNGGPIVELGEQLYNGDLKLTNHTIDAFGRPSRYWEYKGNAIGTYAKKELLVNGEVLHEEVKGRDAYNLLGQTAINDKDLLVFVDGAENKDITKAHLVRSNTEKLARTGKGVMTEFYVDNDYNEITIAIINTWLAEAQNDYSTVNEDIRLDVYYDVYNAGNSTVGVPAARTYSPLVELEDWPIIEGMKDGDLVRVTMAAPDHVGNASYTGYTIESIVEPDVVADATLSDYSAGNKVYSTTPFTRLDDVTTDGTRYSAAEKAIYDEELFFNYSADVEGQLRDATYNLYLDQYGNLLGIRQVEKDDKYIFVVGYDQGSSVLAQAIDQALIINTDGTMATVNIDDSKLRVWDDATGNWVDADGNRLVNVGNGDDSSVNAWFTYDVKSDGTYVLDRMVKNQGVQTRYQTGAKTEYIDNMNGTLTSAINAPANDYLGTGHDMPVNAVAYGNDDSVYITVKADKSVDAANGSIVKVRGVTTGLRNASIRPESVAALNGIDYDTFFIYNDKGYVTYAVVIGNEGAAGYEYLYLNSAIKRTTNDEANDRYLYTYNVIRNGQLVDIQSTVNKAHTVTAYGAGALTTVSTNATADPQRGDLVRAAIDKDGLITEMTILPETKRSEMKPEYNADYGYTYKVDYNSVDYNANLAGQQNNPKDVDAQNIIRLRTNGYTLWVVTEATEDNYTLLSSNATFLVKNPKSAKDDYSVYSAEGAVSATQANNVKYISSVATVNDPITGYASSVIIDVVYDDDTTPGQTPPSVSGLGEGASWDNASKSIKLRYYKDLLTDDEIKSYIGNAFGSPVTNLNKFMGTATLADGTVVPVDFGQIEIIKVSLDDKQLAWVDAGVATYSVTVPAASTKYLKDAKYSANGTTDIVTSTAGKALTNAELGANPAADIELYTAYGFTLNNNVTIALEDTTALSASSYVAPNTKVVVTGNDTSANYRQFTVNGAKVGSPVKGDGATASTMTWTVTENTTFGEVTGVMVKVGTTELGVYANGEDVTFTGYAAGTQFAAASDFTAKKFHTATKLTVTESVNGFTYQVATAKATAGVLELVPVVTVVLTGCEAVYKDADNANETIAAGTAYVTTGIGKLTVTDTGTAAVNNIKLNIATTDRTSELTDVAAGVVGGANATAAYTVQTTDLGGTLTFTVA